MHGWVRRLAWHPHVGVLDGGGDEDEAEGGKGAEEVTVQHRSSQPFQHRFDLFNHCKLLAIMSILVPRFKTVVVSCSHTE